MKRSLCILLLLAAGLGGGLRAQDLLEVKRVELDSLVRFLRREFRPDIYFVKDPAEQSTFSVSAPRGQFLEAAFDALREKGYIVSSYGSARFILHSKSVFTSLPSGYFDDGLSAETFYYSAMAFAIVVGLFSAYGHYYNHLMDPDTQTVGTDYMALHIVMLLALNNITVALIFMQRAWVLALPKTLFLVASIFVYYLCLLATQKYAKYRIKRVGMFYGGFFAVFAVYAAAMLLTSRLPMLNIGLTAAFIYLQLYMLHYGGKTLPSGKEIITGGSDE